MLPSSREITFYAPISRMSLADDSTLNVIDNNCTLHKIDLEKLQITKSTSLSNVYEERFFDYYKRPFALGKRRAYLSFSKQGTEYVIDTKDKLVKISHFSYSKNAEVTKAEFSENDKLLISGNERGKVYIINTQDGSIQTELPRSSDTITAVALSDAFRLGAYASFSKKILVYKFSSQKVVFEKKLDAVVEMISFVDDNTLLAITRNGKILKINIDRGTIQETLLDENIWPSVITLSHSKKFVYVGTRESVVFALHVKTLSLLFQLKLAYIGITSMVRSPHFFIVGFKTGEVSFFSHREFEEQFILNIKLKKIKEASLLFRKNIFLMSHRDTRYIYDYWLEQKETITNLLSLGEIEQARLLAEPFLFHPKCTLEFSELELLQPDLMSLERYFRSSSFSAAYELIQVKPMLRKSSIYGKMEALWNKNLQKAQIVLSRDPVLNKDAAKDSLSLFAEVEEKKSIIENMLKNARVFMLAESAIKSQNFSLYFKMVSQNTFLEFTPLYKKVLLLGEKLQMQIVTYLEEKDYKQSLSFAGLLSQFTPYRNQAIRLKEVSNALLILEYQMEHKMLKEAVTTQDQFNLQTNYALVQKLEEMKLLFQKEQLEGIEHKNYTQVYMAMSPYMHLSVCATNVAIVMKKMYIAQFKDVCLDTTHTVNWEKTFVEYLHFFTLDKLLVEFAKEINKIDILKTETTIKITPGLLTYPKSLIVFA